jgi:hypothetical protein
MFRKQIPGSPEYLGDQEHIEAGGDPHGWTIGQADEKAEELATSWHNGNTGSVADELYLMTPRGFRGAVLLMFADYLQRRGEGLAVRRIADMIHSRAGGGLVIAEERDD